MIQSGGENDNKIDIGMTYKRLLVIECVRNIELARDHLGGFLLAARNGDKVRFVKRL